MLFRPAGCLETKCLIYGFSIYSPEEFENLAEIVMDSPDFGSDTTQFFLSALEEAEYSLDEEEEA